MYSMCVLRETSEKDRGTKLFVVFDQATRVVVPFLIGVVGGKVTAARWLPAKADRAETGEVVLSHRDPDVVARSVVEKQVEGLTAEEVVSGIVDDIMAVMTPPPGFARQEAIAAAVKDMLAVFRQADQKIV